MKIIFTRHHSIGSLLIRMVTWSKWSHVAVINDTHVIESLFIGGVQINKLHELTRRSSEFKIVTIPGIDMEEAFQLAKTQLGKPYDWTAILGIFFHRNWQDTDSWFCSEHVSWVAKSLGKKWFRDEAVHKITPENIWMLNL